MTDTMISQQVHTDPNIRTNLEALARRFDEAYNNGDVTTAVNLFTTDGVLVTESGVVHGRQALERYYLELFQQKRISNSQIRIDQNSPFFLGTTGTEIFETGSYSDTVQQLHGGQAQQNRGFWSAICQRQGGDNWKVRMLSLSDSRNN